MRSKNVIDLRNKRTDTHKAPPQAHAVRIKDIRRASPTRTRRRRWRIALLSVLFVLLVAGVYGVHVASYAERFTVQNAVITGGTPELQADVHDFALQELQATSTSFLSSKSIFLYNVTPLATALFAAFPQIASIKIEHAGLFSSTLSIHIVERTAYGWWCDAFINCYAMDAGGKIFAPATATTSMQRFVFRGGITATSSPIGQTFLPTHIVAIVAILNAFTNAGVSPVGATAVNDQDFNINLSDGSYIKASYDQLPETVVKNVTLVRNSNELKYATSTVDYIDARFGDRVYYKLKSGASSTAGTSTPVVN
jgi:cell division septal protein FtsQ